MSDPSVRINSVLEEGTPRLAGVLSPLGRRVFMPAGIPVQAQEAKDCTFNGTIGLLTDGDGGALPLPSMAATLASLSSEDRTRAFLYSPVTGLPELRQRWRRWQRRTLGTTEGEALPSSLPLVTGGLSHGLSLIADLLGGEGRTVVVPEPFWGNYRHVFSTRTGARLVSAPAFRDGRFNCRVFEEAVEGAPDLAPGEPVLAVLNLPSNPGGYSLTDQERREVLESLLRIAETRTVVSICDDAYTGLVYEDSISPRSMYWDLLGAHENLIPIKVDGATKEFSFFGGRVGFVTFPFEPESAVAKALESKLGGLVRATVGSPSASSQILLLQALRRDGVEEEVEAIRLLLAGRYRKLKAALQAIDPSLGVVQPFNSGSFALLELPKDLGVTAEQVRRHLLENHDTGVVSVGERFVRIAHCSVAEEALPELVRRLESGISELAGLASPAVSG